MSRSGFSVNQVRGPGCGIAYEVEVTTPEDLNETFQSLAQAEVKPPGVYVQRTENALDSEISPGVQEVDPRIRGSSVSHQRFSGWFPIPS